MASFALELGARLSDSAYSVYYFIRTGVATEMVCLSGIDLQIYTIRNDPIYRLCLIVPVVTYSLKCSLCPARLLKSRLFLAHKGAVSCDCYKGTIKGDQRGRSSWFEVIMPCYMIDALSLFYLLSYGFFFWVTSRRPIYLNGGLILLMQMSSEFRCL
ncbi:hypothetical protein Ancab_020579, partial [Ancistrocladus abbreviatus]